MANNTTPTPTLGGSPVKLYGEFPQVGKVAPPFSLVNKDLQNITLDSFAGKRKVLNIVPSLDTPTCQASARRFNKEAARLDNAVVINISADLPFAMARFCSSEGLDNVVNLSVMDRKSTRLNSSHLGISYAVFCLKKKKKKNI